MATDTHIKTSVIIPVYNTEDYLPVCLDSVLSQTQEEIEVILVDDGSTDGSPTIEQAYADRDPRVRIIRQQNLRQGTARNRGLAEARGEYVYFMDSDDVIMPDLFDACHAACEGLGLDFVTFDSAGFVDDPNVERPDLFGEILDRSTTVSTDLTDGPSFWTSYIAYGMLPFVCWLQYFRRSFLIENDLRFVEGVYFEDNDWIVRVYMAARRIKYMPLKLHRYRHRLDSNVHSGFKPVLADSCFDVHAILCDLALRHVDDPVRLGMVKIVEYSVDHRFRQFAEIGQTEDLIRRATAFSRETARLCVDPTLPDAIRFMHLKTLVNLYEGTLLWKGMPELIDEGLVASTMLLGMPTADEAPVLGIYGTGKVCKAFLDLLDKDGRTCHFFVTEARRGQTFERSPVHDIGKAAEFDLDAMVIASSKYADEMKGQVARVLGPKTRVFVTPRELLDLEEWGIVDHLRHPRSHRAYRILKQQAKRLLGHGRRGRRRTSAKFKRS